MLRTALLQCLFCFLQFSDDPLRPRQHPPNLSITAVLVNLSGPGANSLSVRCSPFPRRDGFTDPCAREGKSPRRGRKGPHGCGPSLLDYTAAAVDSQEISRAGQCQVVLGLFRKLQNGLRALKSGVTLYCLAGKVTEWSGSASPRVFGRKLFRTV